jgi:hypothetical protein
MDLTVEERKHFNWQKSIYFEKVGRFISAISLLEGFMIETVCIHFSDTKKKREDLFKYVLADTSLKFLSEIYLNILNDKYNEFYSKNISVVKHIKILITRRNLLCHSHFHADAEFIKKFDKQHVLIRNIRRFEESAKYIKKLSLKEQDEYIKYIDELNELLNKFRKQLKLKKIG